MPLLERTGWKTDEWVRYDAWLAAPAILVPPTTLATAVAALTEGQRIGVELPNTFQPLQLKSVQDRLDLVAVDFPGFADGRGFSIGRMLRGQGYTGTLRAVGSIIPDQFAFALECGFDEVEIGDHQAARQPIEQWLHALTLVDVSYQQSGERTSILQQRKSSSSRRKSGSHEEEPASSTGEPTPNGIPAFAGMTKLA